MADNERTISTKFTADISDFSASTQQLNRYVRTTKAEFAAATASMGDWSKSADGLSAKIEEQSRILQAQKVKLSNLQASYDKLTDEQKKSTKQGQDLYAAIKNQEAAVKKTEKEVGDYTKALEDLENQTYQTTASTKDLNSATEKTGYSAGDLAKKIGGGIAKGIAGIATACAGAVTGFLSLAESTRETRTQLNQIETSFTQAGFSAKTATDTFTELVGVLGDSGKASEASLHMAQLANSEDDLTKLTTIATGVYSRFGDSLPIEGLMEASNETAKTGKITGVLADALNWAGETEDEFQKKLNGCTTEQERQALITDTLNGLYGESAEAYRETNGAVIEAEKAQQNLTNATARLGAIAEPIMTALKNVAAELLGQITPFVELIGNGLTGAFTGASDGAAQFAEGLSGIVGTVVGKVSEMAPSVVSIVSSLIPSLISSLLDQVPNVLGTLSTIASQVLASLGQMIPQVVSKVVEVVPRIIQSLLSMAPQLFSAAVTFLSSIVDAIPSVVMSLVQALPQIIQNVVSTLISNIPTIILAGIKLLSSLSQAIPSATIEIVKSLPEIIVGIVQGILSGIPEMIKAGGELIKGLWGGIKEKLDWLKDKIKNVGESIIGWFKKVFKINSPSKVFADVIGKNIALGIGEGFADEMEDVQKEMADSVDPVDATLGVNSGNLSSSSSIVSSAFNGIAEKIAELINQNNGGGVNNYSFSYNFEKMESSRLAIHKAELETRRIVGGKA